MQVKKTTPALLREADRQIKKKKFSYLEGHEEEKVWDTFQSTKKLKRSFVEVCKKHNINKSKFIRSCITLLIEKDGDLGAVFREFESD